MQEFNNYITYYISSQPLIVGQCILTALALLIILGFYFAFGGTTKIIRSRKNKMLDLNKKINKLDITLHEKQVKVCDTEKQIARLQQTLVAEHVVREDNTFALAKKINELYSLREKELISASKMGELLAQFASSTAQNINVEKSLTSLKALQEKGFIDESGYERVSAVLVQIYFSSDIGVLGKAKQYVRKLGL